ncbi:MAG: aspartate/glutamate racemase family protein [Firmicutes bacterium]|nr:aspartate/glutamate racemase family protein [Bacillota bacterium]
MNRKNEKVLGVIGGMGPLASQLFYGMVIRKTEAYCDQDHIDMIILNHASMPDRTEAILAGDMDTIIDQLDKDIAYLASGGADLAVMTCNTAHSLIDILRERTDIELVDMIDTAAAYLKQLGAKRVGILATDGTIKEGLYQKACARYGMEAVLPSDGMQKKVMEIIYDGIKDGGPLTPEDILPIEKEMVGKGCDKLLLACTELSCYRDIFGLPDIYVDALEALADIAIIKCGKKLKG